MFTKTTKIKQQSGQLLLEVILAIAASAIIVTLGAQMAYVSLYSNKAAEEKNVAIGLIEETFEAINSIATEKWQNIYELTKGSDQYHVATSTDKWVTQTASEIITINQKNYTRYFTVQNVCRDNSTTRDITGITDTDGSANTCVTSGGVFDPSTQKINVTVSWQGAEPITFSDYLMRWRNKTCSQADWGGGTDTTPTTCPSNKHGGTDGNLDTSNGELKLQ